MEAPKHPGNLGQDLAGLTSRVCSLRFNLVLSFLLLPSLPGLSALAQRTNCPFLLCSNLKCICRWSSVFMSSLEKHPQFYLPTCFPGAWLYYMILKSIITTFLCIHALNFRAKETHTVTSAFSSRVMQSTGMLFLETAATAEFCNRAEWQMICVEKQRKNVLSVYPWENALYVWPAAVSSLVLFGL